MKSHWALALVLLTLSSSNAVAQDDATVTGAYEDMVAGAQAFEENQPEEALDKFSRAYAILKLPGLAVVMARAQVKLGHLVAAASLYSEAQRLNNGLGFPEAQQEKREEAKVELEALRRRIPHLFIKVRSVSPNSVTFQLDSVSTSTTALAAGYPVDPGTHRVVAQAGNQRQELLATVGEGESKEILFNFQLEPPPLRLPPPSGETSSGNKTMRTATWVSFGMGGAALAVSGTTAIWALAKSRALDKQGPWNVGACEHAPDPSICEQYRQLRTISTVGFYTGLASLATGSILYLTTPRKPDTKGKAASINPWLGVGAAGVAGTF